MASGLLSAELAATCNALGFYDGLKYHLEPHSKETIKDIIRYLRRDEESHDIRRFLGNSKILKTDLLPILQCHSKEKDLFDLILRLIVNLSTPALIVYNEVVPTDKSDLNQYLQIVSHLQTYKESFSDHKSWAVLSEQLSILLNKDIEARDEDDQRTIERILILVRNILHVPSDPVSEGRPDNDASVHDQVIWALHQSSMLDLLLYMASSSQESGFFMHLLEIICLLVREQPPALLAKTAAQRSSEEKHRDEEELIHLRQKEQQFRQNKTRQYLGARHSNFGGTFVIKNMKSVTDNDLIYHKPLHRVNHFSLDIDKREVRIPKNRQPLKCANTERRSALSVRLILKQFCVEILNAAYNPLMRHIKDCLSHGKTQDNDESYYFTAMKFFMEFNRNYKVQVKLVSETMSVESFHFTQKYLETWHEMMITDKKKIALWSARMHLALKAYKELLQNLAVMDSHADKAVQESSKVIKSNIFYVIEYREMLLTLINTYKKSKYSQQYLVDLMETIHIFLKLLEKFCQNKKVVVQETVRKRNKSKAPKKKQVQENPCIAEELWPQINESLEKVLVAPITREVLPFDAVSEKTMEEQKIDAMKRIQMLLKAGDIEESIALLRSARDVWPENDCFGNPKMSQEQEIDCLKEVFLATLDVPGSLPDRQREEPANDEEEDSEEETIYPTLSEKTFEVMDLIKRFASPKVLGVCITLLSTFQKNSAFTNHCVAKMLHRIAWECKLPSLLFQASLFRKFQLILQSNEPAYKELAGLGKHVFRKFLQVAETNKKVFMELLFFKHAKDAYEIECGYGSFQSKTKSSIQNWEEHEEEELRKLHEEYLQILPQEEMVKWIAEQMINERSERIVKKKLKEMGLFVLTKNKKGFITSWTEEQEEELRDTFIKLRDENIGEDVIDTILSKLNVNRTRQNVSKTLVKLGLAESTKEFRKKAKKSGPGRKGPEDSSETETDEEEEELHQETHEEIRAKDSIPDLYFTTKLMFSEKEINSYLTEGLKWLSSCMQDCLEDLDEPTEVPLLPLSSEALLSVENSEFILFLRSLGIHRPLQQEIYWRFSADWKETDFKSRQQLINMIAENETMDNVKVQISLLIREITGKDTTSNFLNKSSQGVNESPPSSPSSTSFSKVLKNSSKNTFLELENLVGNTKKIPEKKNQTPLKKIKMWSAEDMEKASIEDFDTMVSEQCRELLQKEGMYFSSQTKNPKNLLSDSDDEDSRPFHNSADDRGTSKDKSKLLNSFMSWYSEGNVADQEKIFHTNFENLKELGGNNNKKNDSPTKSAFQSEKITISGNEEKISDHTGPKKTIKRRVLQSDSEDEAEEYSSGNVPLIDTNNETLLKDSSTISEVEIHPYETISSKRFRDSDSESDGPLKTKNIYKRKKHILDSDDDE